MGWIVRGWTSKRKSGGPPDFEHVAQYVPDVHDQVRAAIGLGCVIVEIEKDDEHGRS